MKTFNELKAGEYFRLSGYDDLFQKLSDYRAKDLGCGWLKKPIRLARKGTKVQFDQSETVFPSA